MSVSQKSLILAICFTLIAIVLYRLAAYFEQPVVRDFSHLPTLTGSGLHGLTFDNLGRIENILVSEVVTYDERRKLVTLNNSHLAHFDYKEDEKTTKIGKLWNLTADKAVIYTDNKAVLTGNVKAYPGFKDAPIKRIETTEAEYNMKTNQVTSSAEVYIKGPNWENRGKDFQADLSTNQITFKDQPNVVYYPNKP
ncbi:MAG: LPS export ABC transporter periplasmic protein LptC [Succinivibrio sp.]|nr:LPS export ABC transporter periplasmic protein LptC [Succinivibrio sp.]